MTDEWGSEEDSEFDAGIVRNWQGRPYILANPDWTPEQCAERDFKLRGAEKRGPSKMYTRCTTYVGCLEDTFALGQWQERMVVTGMAFDDSLVDLAQSLDFAGDEKVLKTELDKIAKDAKDAAKWKLKANKGTAFHKVIEYYDNVGSAPAAANRQTRRLLDAYARVTDGWEYAAIEQFMVNDEFEVGGTPDRLRKKKGSTQYRVTDLKTGGHDLKFGRAKMEMQMGMYAISKAYDEETGIRTEFDIDLEFAEIVHCPIGTNEAYVYKVPITPAIKALTLARDVRAWRAHKTDWQAYDSSETIVVPSERLDTQNSALSAQAAAWSIEPAQGI